MHPLFSALVNAPSTREFVELFAAESAPTIMDNDESRDEDAFEPIAIDNSEV
jgi:hypothetical protein